MSARQSATRFVAIGAIALAAAAHAAPTSTQRFPTVDAETLGGASVRVPQGLPGTRRVLLVAFKREDSDALDAHFAALRPLEAAHPGVAIVETPVIGAVNAVLRAIITAAQRAGVPEARRDRYVPLFVEADTVRSALGLHGDGMHAVIVDARGAVLALIPLDAPATSAPVARVRAALLEPPARP